jgi:WD40 repeat protein
MCRTPPTEMDQHASGDYQKLRQLDTTQLAAEGGYPAAVIPDHQLLRCIGRGSYGAVWLARNMMGMYRAVKVVYRKSFQSDRPFERELSGIRKFEPISRSHEGFVDVLQVGINEEQGYFYYVMELGDDEQSEQVIDPQRYHPKTLAKEISRQGRLPMKAALELGIALSQALAELHKKGLVHRDVKPSNVIFVNGVAKLADIGLVADFNEARSYVGTEGFIPPEGPGAPQADVYSLGKVLYEASTGKDRQDFPELPTEVDTFPDQDLFVELNEIILRACRNEPAQRYRSAWDMYTDLLVVTDGKSVKRLNLLERRFGNLKRIAAFCAIGLLILTAISYPFVHEYRLRVESRQRQVGAIVGYGTQAIDALDPSLALLNFAQAVDFDRGSVERETLQRLRFGSALQQCPRLTAMWFAPQAAQGAAFSPDGQHVLAAQRQDVVHVFDIATGKPILQLDHPGQLSRAVYSSDGTLIGTASDSKTACVWRSSDGVLVATLPHPDTVYSATFSPDGSRLVTGCADKLARVWDWGSEQVVLTLKQHTKEVLFAGYSPDGRRLVTGGRDSTAQLWDAINGQPMGAALPHASWVRHAAFSPNGRTLATAVLDNKGHVWDLTGKSPRSIPPDLAHADRVFHVDFSPDSRLIITAGLDNTARIWLVSNHQPPAPVGVLRHSARVICASFDHTGRRVVTSANDGTIRVWDFAAETLPPVVPSTFSLDGTRYLVSTPGGCEVREAHSDRLLSPLIPIDPAITNRNLNRNGQFVLGTTTLDASSNNVVRLFQVWEAATAHPIGPGIRATNSPFAVLSDDGRCLLTGAANLAQLWDVAGGRSIANALSHTGSVVSACSSRDGAQIATWDQAIAVWDGRTGKASFNPVHHGEAVRSVQFSPDGLRLLTCQANQRLTPMDARVWDARTGKLLLKLPHGDGVLYGTFSSDGARIVTCGEDFKAIVWDATSGEELARLDHQDQVLGAAFSLDGQWVVTASADRTARVWMAETGEPLTPPLRHLIQVQTARFMPEGRKIVTIDLRGEARVWELQIDPAASRRLAPNCGIAVGSTRQCGGQDAVGQCADAPRALGRNPNPISVQFLSI